MDNWTTVQMLTRVATMRSAAQSAMDDLRLASETEAFAARALANVAEILGELERLDSSIHDRLEAVGAFDSQRQTSEESVRLAFSGI